MAKFVNTFALSADRILSSEIGPLGMVAHKIDTAGRYFGRVYQEETQVAQFEVIVEDEPTHGQADVDLANLVARPGEAQRKAARYKMTREGYSIFFVSAGAGGYHVTLEVPVGKNNGEARVVFDSQKLAENDLFVVTLIRPGVWLAYDRSSASTAEVTVSYPEVSEKAYRPVEQAAMITVGPKGMTPNALKIGPAEGVVFQIAKEATSLSVELAKPDEGPTKVLAKGKRRARWTNPRPPKAS